ncbi:MAG: glycosyltransferase [Anaerolineae bacterium]|nr:glycosyltransferase [Anaerolineae bacterium]
MNKTPTSLAKLGIKSLFLIWGAPIGTQRSKLIAEALDMDVEYVYFTKRQGKLIAILKYFVQGLQTVGLLFRKRPRVIFVQNPPIFGPMVVYLWSLMSGAKFIIDSHTDALRASWWEWSLPIHRFLSRRAMTTIVTNEHLYEMVRDWDAAAFILTDVPSQFQIGTFDKMDRDAFNIVMISTASYDEPIDQVMSAIAKLPDINLYITGNYARAHQHVIDNAPPNVHFTGYLPDDEFYGMLTTASAVMCLTTENHTMQSGASEALWLSKPIITSDWPILREYFNQGTLHVDNTTAGIYRAMVQMRDNLPAYQDEIFRLQSHKRLEWQRKAGELISMIQAALQNGKKQPVSPSQS